tara:strand:- start:710 stop:1003 length:294 start_codon:yes stop_codon:yes gene_type:complete
MYRNSKVVEIKKRMYGVASKNANWISDKFYKLSYQFSRKMLLRSLLLERQVRAEKNEILKSEKKNERRLDNLSKMEQKLRKTSRGLKLLIRSIEKIL